MTFPTDSSLQDNEFAALSAYECDLVSGAASTMEYAAGGLGGAVSGFGVGASLGAIGGPVGALVGGLAGFGVGAVGGFIAAHYLAE